MKTFQRSAFAKSKPESRQARNERNLRQVRQIIFDLPQEKEEKGMRILEKLKKELSPPWETNNNQAYSDMMLRTFA